MYLLLKLPPFLCCSKNSKIALEWGGLIVYVVENFERIKQYLFNKEILSYIEPNWKRLRSGSWMTRTSVFSISMATLRKYECCECLSCRLGFTIVITSSFLWFTCWCTIMVGVERAFFFLWDTYDSESTWMIRKLFHNNYVGILETSVKEDEETPTTLGSKHRQINDRYDSLT